jgi:hypothetical protein
MSLTYIEYLPHSERIFSNIVYIQKKFEGYISPGLIRASAFIIAVTSELEKYWKKYHGDNAPIPTIKEMRRIEKTLHKAQKYNISTGKY